jgi:hypothetical protein
MSTCLPRYTIVKPDDLELQVSNLSTCRPRTTETNRLQNYELKHVDLSNNIYECYDLKLVDLSNPILLTVVNPKSTKFVNEIT